MTAAFFQGANLSKASLDSAQLQNAFLMGANLAEADLKGAILDFANLPRANLYSAHLQGADLEGVDLQNANLENVDLQGADLKSAKLQDANLKYANLQGAYLESSQLQYFDSTTDFQGAYLYSDKSEEDNLNKFQFQPLDLENSELQVDRNKLIDLDTRKILKNATNNSLKIDNDTAKNLKNTTNDFSKLKAYIPCLTDDDKLTDCKKYSKADTQTLNKITSYWINNLACSDKWIAQGIINNYLINDKKGKFKDYLIPLLSKRVDDKSCKGIQNLPDDIRNVIKSWVSVIEIPDDPPPPITTTKKTSSKPRPSSNWKIEKDDKIH